MLQPRTKEQWAAVIDSMSHDEIAEMLERASFVHDSVCWMLAKYDGILRGRPLNVGFDEWHLGVIRVERAANISVALP